MASLTLWQQSEVVRKGAFPVWATKKFNVLSDLIKRGEVQQIGERDFRIPFLKTYGGSIGAYDPQMGDMGRGTMPTGDKMIGSYFSLRLNFELDMLSIKATQDRKIALSDPFKDSVARGFYEFQLYLDKYRHSSGFATIGTGSTTTTSSGDQVYTLTAPFGTQLLRRGQYVNVYNTGFTSLLAANMLVKAINSTARTVTLSGLVSGAANTDKLTFPGVTWTSGTAPTGIRGLYYWLDYTTSGTTAGVDRAAEPEIQTNYVDGSSTGPTTEAVLALQDRIQMRRGEVANDLMGICPNAQRSVIWSNVQAIQRIDLGGTQAQAVDRMPTLKGKQSFMWGGIPHMVDIHQMATRIDYSVPTDFGIARLDEMKFFQTPGSNQRFFPLYGASGAPAAGVWFGLVCDEDLYHINPGAAGVLYGLPQSGFYA